MVTAPEVVIRPILLGSGKVNHKAPSGPVVISCGWLANGIVNSVMTPLVVIRPILPFTTPVRTPSVNQRAPSGPKVISAGKELVDGSENSVITPEVLILPIL